MSQIQRILCAIDFSETSQAAFEFADELAATLGAELVVLHAFDRPASYDEVGQRIPADKSVTEKMDRLTSKHEGVTLTRMTHAGLAEEVICWAAEARGCSIIVMGTHGRTGLQHLLFGSTAEYVVRHARCPVLTIRPQAKDQDRKPLPEPIVSPMPAPRYL